MNKIILMVLTFVACCSSFCNLQAQSASTRVFSEEGYKFWLVLNGIRQNDEPKASVEVQGLKAQLYRARVIFENEDLAPLDQNIFTSDVDGKVYHSVYRIRERRTFFGNPTGELVVRLQSADVVNGERPTFQQEPIDVREEEEQAVQQSPPAREPREREESEVKQSERTSRTEQQRPDFRGRVSHPHDRRGSRRQPPIEDRAERSAPEEKSKEVETPKSYVEGYHGRIGCSKPMSADAFKRALNTIENQSFSSTQLDVAKQVVDANCLSVQQVKAITQIFSFENGRLEFAKYAYHSTHDVDNYFELNDVFSFSASVSELSEYIKLNR